MGVGVLAPTQLASDSLIKGYDKKLRMKSLLEDIYGDLQGLYNTETKTIPEAIYMEIDMKAMQGANSTVVTMKKPLSGAGVFGNSVAIGNEERPVTKTMTIYRNNCRKVVTTPGYGVRKLDAEAYKLYEQHIEDVGTWNKEEEGLEIRQGFVQRYGETLIHGDTQALCTQNYNPNIFVCGLSLRNANPTYSSVVATYTTNIVQKIIDAGGGSIVPTVGQTLNQPNLSNISNFAMKKRISNLKIPGLPGGRGYILTISELQATYLGDPAWSERNLGSMYIQLNKLPERVQNWTGVIGAFKDLLLVVDPRQPTLNPTGSSSPFGLSAGYMYPGDIDLRYRDDQDVCDTAFLHGRGSVVKWTAEKLHNIIQLDDYGAVVGSGSATVRGIQLPIYDQVVPSLGSYEYFSGALILCRLPDYV